MTHPAAEITGIPTEAEVPGFSALVREVGDFIHSAARRPESKRMNVVFSLFITIDMEGSEKVGASIANVPVDVLLSMLRAQLACVEELHASGQSLDGLPVSH
jgi:hypothetical protein